MRKTIGWLLSLAVLGMSGVAQATVSWFQTLPGSSYNYSGLSTISVPGNTAYLFAVQNTGPRRHLVVSTFGYGMGPWVDLGGDEFGGIVPTDGPASSAISWNNNYVDVYAWGGNLHLVHKSSDGQGHWGGWEDLARLPEACIRLLAQ